MKRFLFILLMAFTMSFVNVTKSDAQTYYYKTFQFAIKYKYSSGWGSWSDWKDSNMKVKIDLDDDVIVIYSPQTQVYQVISEGSSYTDDSGGKNLKFKVIDQDDDIGYVRLRVERNGNSQLYVEYGDVVWVYNVRKIEY